MWNWLKANLCKKFSPRVFTPYSEQGIVPDQKCPACRTRINDGTLLAGARKGAPVKHDLGLCYKCGAMLTFNQKGRLAVLHNEEWEKLPDGLQRMLLKAQSLVVNGHGERSRGEWEEPDGDDD